MYRINVLGRNTLITTDEVLKHAPTKQTFDPRNIEQAIIIAELRFIKPLIGYTMYKGLIDQKNTLCTAGNKATLQALIDDETGYTYTIKEGEILNASEFLNTNNLALWNWVLWKLAAEAVMLTAMPEGFVQFSAKGLTHAAPTSINMNASGDVTPDLRSVKWAIDKKLQDRIDPLVEELKSYICDNKGKYSSYAFVNDCPGCNEKDGTSSRKTSWITSIYDNTDNDCC